MNRVGMTVASVASGAILTETGLSAGTLKLAGGRFVNESTANCAGATIDATGLIVAPGLIDSQINGAYGNDFTDDPKSIWTVGRRLPEQGVTAFVPTIISSPAHVVANARSVMLAGPPPGYAGATPIGLHCEGPMLSPSHRGTHLLEHLARPSLEAIDGWNPEGGIAMVTIAPELPGALAVIEELTRRNVVVAVGHSGATLEEAEAAFAAGATAGTHIYNAMSGFNHRSPGLVGALLSNHEVTVGIIVDCLHSHPAAVDIAWKAKGPHRIMLVTDALAATGMPYGCYHIGDVTVIYESTGARNESGGLAGSVLTLDQAVRNLIEFTGCSVDEALGSATTVPARLFGFEDRGRISPGAVADLVLLDDELDVVMTIIGGAIAYERSTGQSDDHEPGATEGKG